MLTHIGVYGSNQNEYIFSWCKLKTSTCIKPISVKQKFLFMCIIYVHYFSVLSNFVCLQALLNWAQVTGCKLTAQIQFGNRKKVLSSSWKPLINNNFGCSYMLEMALFYSTKQVFGSNLWRLDGDTWWNKGNSLTRVGLSFPILLTVIIVLHFAFGKQQPVAMLHWHTDIKPLTNTKKSFWSFNFNKYLHFSTALLTIWKINISVSKHLKFSLNSIK